MSAFVERVFWWLLTASLVCLSTPRNWGKPSSEHFRRYYIGYHPRFRPEGPSRLHTPPYFEEYFYDAYGPDWSVPRERPAYFNNFIEPRPDPLGMRTPVVRSRVLSNSVSRNHVRQAPAAHARRKGVVPSEVGKASSVVVQPIRNTGIPNTASKTNFVKRRDQSKNKIQIPSRRPVAAPYTISSNIVHKQPEKGIRNKALGNRHMGSKVKVNKAGASGLFQRHYTPIPKRYTAIPKQHTPHPVRVPFPKTSSPIIRLFKRKRAKKRIARVSKAKTFAGLLENTAMRLTNTLF